MRLLVFIVGCPCCINRNSTVWTRKISTATYEYRRETENGKEKKACGKHNSSVEFRVYSFYVDIDDVLDKIILDKKIMRER